MRLREEGAQVIIAGEEKGKKYTGKYGVPAVSEASFLNQNPSEFFGILIPGGWAPDKLRRFPELLQFIRDMGHYICQGGSWEKGHQYPCHKR